MTHISIIFLYIMPSKYYKVKECHRSQDQKYGWCLLSHSKCSGKKKLKLKGPLLFYQIQKSLNRFKHQPFNCMTLI